MCCNNLPKEVTPPNAGWLVVNDRFTPGLPTSEGKPAVNKIPVEVQLSLLWILVYRLSDNLTLHSWWKEFIKDWRHDSG